MTLYESHGTRKKSSEQLRSSSIDGSCRMVRTGTRKMQKRSMCFWISGHHISVMLLTTIFLMFWVLGWLWKIKIRSRKSIFVKFKNFIQNIFFEDWSFFSLAAKFCVLHFFRFCLKKIISAYFCSMLYYFFHFLIYFFCQKSSQKLTRLGP